MLIRNTDAENTTGSGGFEKPMLAAVRPKDGYEGYDLLLKGIPVEVPDTHAWQFAKALEHRLGSFTFKLSAKNKGWALFSRW